MWTGHSLFQDHEFTDDDELRATVTGQLDDLLAAPVERPVRLAVPARSARRS
ncbi:hypothetical protein [Kitasatospora fiedleri]|nr:hypothetical protein [Kitasatospora fiedleri]